MYCTTSPRFTADSKTLGFPLPPTNSVRYPSRSRSTTSFRCSFLTLSTALILLNWSSLIVPALEQPSQGIGRLRMLFWSEARYGGGSKDIFTAFLSSLDVEYAERIWAYDKSSGRMELLLMDEALIEKALAAHGLVASGRVPESLKTSEV